MFLIAFFKIIATILDMSKNIFNISTSNSFTDVLAQKFLSEYQDNYLGLADILFLLPSRRAVQSLKEAFLRAFGLKPLILPQMIAVGEIDSDELLIKSVDFDKVSASISANERLFTFMKLLLAKENTSLEQAYFLSLELANLLDEASQNGVDFKDLENLVPENFATHWIETLNFLKIITQYWPEILKEKNKIDIGAQKKQIIELQAEIWKKNQPLQKIVIAGISAPHQAIKQLLKVVKDLPNGEIYFYGIDTHLSDDDWQKIDSSHPCFENKNMLKFLDLDRFEVQNYLPAKNTLRENLISEIMRPAQTTELWQNLKKNLAQGLDGIDLVECEDIRQEASIIALLMRKNLENASQTTALITPNRNLARRVCAELKRWHIEVDDSAGRPLHTTAIGNFLRLIVQNCLDDFNVVSFLSLVKHPYFEAKDWVKEYEKKVLRQKKSEPELELEAQKIKANFNNFYQLFAQKEVDFGQLITKHIELAEEFCPKLFAKEEGRVCAKMIADILENAPTLGNIKPKEYLSFLEAFMSSTMVRQNFQTHPKLKILGPIEARFNQYDLTIIGGLNDGTWPLLGSNNPWLNEGMKKDLGLNLNITKTGILANDFSSFLCNSKVVLTRSKKVEGTPMIKSRWLLRLETVAKALGTEPDKKLEFIYKKLATIINAPTEYISIPPAAPKPPVSARPREMSASNIELWMRDPYSIFAKYILSLYPLDDLQEDISVADYGNFIHKILEIFYKKNSTIFPTDAKEQLLEIGKNCFREDNLSSDILIFWQPKFEKIVDWLIEIENNYHLDVKKSHCEISGNLEIDAPAGKFLLKAKADRIDEMLDGNLNIIDYKTGQAKTLTTVYAGYAPQLPVEGLIFRNMFGTDIDNLIYWQLGNKETIINKNIPQLLEDSLERVQKLIASFDFQTTPYHSNPNPALAPKYNDYEHLARLKEWSIKGDSDE